MKSEILNERKVYLTIESSTGYSATFTLPEGFRDGYTNEFQELHAPGQTHPMQHTWKRGKLNDISLELELAVGISPNITTPERLIETIEELYNMALPVVRKPSQIPTVCVVIHGVGGSSYFQRNYLIAEISEEMGAN